MDVCLAVDVGGSKIAAGLVSAEGALLVHEQVGTPPAAGADVLFGAVRSVVDAVVATGPGGDDRRMTACGIGCGGPMDLAAGTVSPLNIPGWRQFPLRRRLAELTGLPTSLDNDAKALALAEGWVGAARHRPDFMAMVVSTGVGGGIVLDGRLLHGATGNAGHVGHVVVEPDGRRCACGGRGCLEAEASGTAIAALTGRPARLAPPAMVARCGRLVGRAVASMVSALDLDLIVVAGSVALGFGSPFFSAANEELRARAGLSFTRSATIVPAGLADHGPLVGAGAVGWNGSGADVLGGSR
ncbi:MAG: ROK family protein [Acidimicrobiales bacterium]